MMDRMNFFKMDSDSNLLLNPAVKITKGAEREYPFPIVTNSCAEGQSDPNWNCVEGHLQNNYVLVHDEEGMRVLYSMGYFGKGTLSKSAPKVCSRKNKKHSNEKDNSCLPGPSSAVDVIDVLDSDDEDPPVKREKDSDHVDVVFDHSSNEYIQLSSKEKRMSSEKESLQLTLEEAYFLSYGLGCLVVMEKNQPMNLARLWNRFCELTPNDNFPIKYTAYHHFRSKGWIVKSGLKYGTDYLLYKDGPPFYHSTYSVIVKGVKEQNLRDLRGNPQLTWASLSALNRVNSTAGKGLLFLYVIKPNSVSDSKICTPFCVQQFKLEEVLFKRWVPSENREESE